MFHAILFTTTGEPAAVDALVRDTSVGANFSFEALLPTPAALDIANDSFSQDGHAAVAGDWTIVAQRRMLREHALARGFPFPLQSRAQAIECFAALGAIGESQLALGRRVEDNIARYGHGYAAGWRQATWGIECDVEAVVAQRADDRFDVAFELCGVPPKKFFATLSKAHPDVRLQLRHVDESGRRAGSLEWLRGKQVRKEVADATATQDTVRAFRREHAGAWLSHVAGVDVGDAIEVDERGAVFFRGARVSLPFALQCLRSGEAAQHFAARVPEVSVTQVELLARLVAAGYR